VNAGLQASQGESRVTGNRLQFRQHAATNLQPAELRQNKHPLDLRILAVVVDNRSTADHAAVHASGEERHVGLPKGIDREQVVAFSRVQTTHVAVEMLDELGNGRRSRVVNLNGNVVHQAWA